MPSFAAMEPLADGFRNYEQARFSVPAEALLIDRAQLLTLTAPEMTVLIGGLRVLGANAGHRQDGVLTSHPGKLTNDFFVNLRGMETQWHPSAAVPGQFEGRDRRTGEQRWSASRVDRFSARTPNCARLPKCMPRPTPVASLSTTSGPRGPKS